MVPRGFHRRIGERRVLDDAGERKVALDEVRDVVRRERLPEDQRQTDHPQKGRLAVGSPDHIWNRRGEASEERVGNGRDDSIEGLDVAGCADRCATVGASLDRVDLRP